MKYEEIPISKFRNKFEYKMSKLSNEKLERIQKIIIKRLSKLESRPWIFTITKKKFKKGGLL